jgi:putative redox protein
MTAQATWVAGMEFGVDAGSGHRLTLDVAGEDGGRDAGFRPMELLLVALAGCSGMDVITILRKKRQRVTGYTVRVQGERAETYPQVFTEIAVEHIVTGHAVDPAAVARAIELSETKYCGVGAMLGATATIRHTFRIVEAPEAGPASPPAIP